MVRLLNTSSLRSYLEDLLGTESYIREGLLNEENKERFSFKKNSEDVNSQGIIKPAIKGLIQYYRLKGFDLISRQSTDMGGFQGYLRHHNLIFIDGNLSYITGIDEFKDELIITSNFCSYLSLTP